jgi:thiamine-monophosphate kinase
VQLGLALARNRAARACVDLSDGLADGVHQLAVAGGVGAIVDADAVPLDPDVREWFARTDRDPLVAAITGGEDYELLFAVPLRHRRLMEAVTRRVGGLPLTRIGAITRDRRVVLRRGGRDEPLPPGYTHFR